MSLITCCPACGTMFKVVPDQLKISEGWVRCGHCAEIFDATAHMQRPQEAVQRSGPEAVAVAAPEPVPDSKQEPVPEPVSALDSGSAVAHEPLEPPVRVAEADTGYPPFEFVRADQDDTPPPSGFGTSTSTSAEPTDFPESESAGESQLDELGFVRKARRKAFWRRPAVRAVLGLVGLLLAGLLALQWAVHDRDRLASLRPELLPWLQALCEPLACEIGAPRQIESIVVDSSSFNRLRSDAYRLSFTLKNQGSVEVAIPAVELTLTDSQDQPVVRRVLQPGDLGAASPVIPAGAEWSAQLALSVAANGSTGRIAGYRLLAFYP